MTDFDAEFYLRRHAEHELRADDDDDSSATERARALVVLGLLPVEQARAILGLYRRARAVRTGDGYFDGANDYEPQSAPPTRVVQIGRAVDAPFGKVQLRYLALGEGRSRVAATVTFGKGGNPRLHMRMRHGLQLDVRDDQGAAATLHFSGGGGQTTWRGQFVSDETLSATTQWLEVLGERVELTEQDSGASVSVRTLEVPGEDVGVRAARYLEHCLEGSRQRHWGMSSALAVVLDTVLASGSLAADSSLVVETRAVGAALSEDAPPADPQLLPERWRSVLTPPKRGRKAPRGELAIGVTTPDFDGISLSVFVLSSTRTKFEVELEGYGALADGLDNARHESPVTFTAVDDVGNRHIGRTEKWHSGGEGFGGTVVYQPPLDPAATRVDLLFSTARTRAEVSVPLRWGATS